MQKLVRRVLVLVAVGVASGVLAYVVNGRNASTASVASQLPQSQAAVPATRPDLGQLAACLRAQGVTLPPGGAPSAPDDGALRAALLACRQYLPMEQVFRDGGFGFHGGRGEEQR
jgi:hypothetical protein